MMSSDSDQIYRGLLGLGNPSVRLRYLLGDDLAFLIQAYSILRYHTASVFVEKTQGAINQIADLGVNKPDSGMLFKDGDKSLEEGLKVLLQSKKILLASNEQKQEAEVYLKSKGWAFDLETKDWVSKIVRGQKGHRRKFLFNFIVESIHSRCHFRGNNKDVRKIIAGFIGHFSHRTYSNSVDLGVTRYQSGTNKQCRIYAALDNYLRAS